MSMNEKSNENKHTQEEQKPQRSEESTLQEQLIKAQEEIAKLKDQALRAYADAENAKKQSEKEISNTKKYAVSSIVKDLINVSEALYHATDHVSEEHKKIEAVDGILQGIELTKKELMAVLSKYLVKRIMPSIGEPFDHNYHQALSQIADDKLPKNSIIKVIQAGYAIDDRLLKPALVVVSAGPAQT